MSRWKTRVEEAEGTSCSKKLFWGLLEAQTEREREEKVVRQHLLNLPQNKIVVLIKKRKLFLTLKKSLYYSMSSNLWLTAFRVINSND